jgi:NhaP-type Na+/H+ or K+/H+ antiporter
MHNPHMIVALGVYIVVLFVSMAIGMTVTRPKQSRSRDPKSVTRRYVAAGVGGAVGTVAALAYAITMRRAVGTATYWANLGILLFGLWTAVYMVVPKLTPAQSATPTTDSQKTAVVASASIALGAAVLAYGVGWKTMRPL